MSFDVDWNIDKYRDDHESEDHWQLRRAFMEKWKNDYPQERLVCLAKVFTNVEILGCRYPTEVMQEIAHLSHEVAKSYRKQKKTKLQRTFVSASIAAEHKAGKWDKIKRHVENDNDDQPKAKIQFIAASKSDENNSGSDNETKEDIEIKEDNETKEDNDVINTNDEQQQQDSTIVQVVDQYQLYLNDMMKIDCLNVCDFKEYMFNSKFGRMVLLVRPWAGKLANIESSCQVCNVQINMTYVKKCFSLTINGELVAQAVGGTRVAAKTAVGILAWERLHKEVVCVFVKEQYIAQNDGPITVNDVSRKRSRDDVFGTPVENSVATKMMQMMGWKGGGLGVDAQGIAEPIKPNLQIVNRAGLGSTSFDIKQLRKAAFALMKRFIASDAIDLDLVFSSEFSKEERALLHQCAQRVGLGSKSYGGKDRFLVVKKKVDPFSLARAVIEKGGTTSKYQVFIPAKLSTRNDA